MKKIIAGLVTLLLLASVACTAAPTSKLPPPATTTRASAATTQAQATTAGVQSNITTTPQTTISPQPGTPQPLGTQSTSDILNSPATYAGQKKELSGQILGSKNSEKLLVDGKSGINLTGKTGNLEAGFYNLVGQYNANNNTLNVTSSVKASVQYTPIEASTAAGINLVPVSIQGLIATPPKEIANTLSSYLSIPDLPPNIPIYPYVIYTRGGLYLILSDSSISLPAKFTCLYQGKDYSFTFCAGQARGILVKTPIEKINFGPNWGPGEIKGVIIADSLAPLTPQNATVQDINASPGNYIFKRVAIRGSYLLTTATVDYSDIQAPMGQGILAESFTDFFSENSQTLETIDPTAKTWQLRQGEVIGTVIYPTDQILKYLDYSAPLSKTDAKQREKPALIVDTLIDNIQEVANISDLNPVTGNPAQYWGKVVEFEGYALGINYPLKQVAKAITASDIPVNVNLLAIGIADNPSLGSQLAIIGLNNNLVGQQGEIIKGRYKFKVAVTQVSNQLVSGISDANTAFFLLSKEQLPLTLPTTLPPVTTVSPLTTTPPAMTTTFPPQTTVPPPPTTAPPTVTTTSSQTTTPAPQTIPPPPTTTLPSTLPGLP